MPSQDSTNRSPRKRTTDMTALNIEALSECIKTIPRSKYAGQYARQGQKDPVSMRQGSSNKSDLDAGCGCAIM